MHIDTNLVSCEMHIFNPQSCGQGLHQRFQNNAFSVTGFNGFVCLTEGRLFVLKLCSFINIRIRVSLPPSCLMETKRCLTRQKRLRGRLVDSCPRIMESQMVQNSRSKIVLTFNKFFIKVKRDFKQAHQVKSRSTAFRRSAFQHSGVHVLVSMSNNSRKLRKTFR